jgi:predicted AlkP superfamily phosphohydrolase/phosphomutase
MPAIAKHRLPRAPARRYTRREFCATAGGAALALAAAGCFPRIGKPAAKISKVIVLAVDGMDPALLERYAAAGRLPNCVRLMRMGAFARLGTSDPPQSPVAWSNFISGTNPGGHGIFDFIARDAATLRPFLSTSRVEPPARTLRLGKFCLPLSGTRAELLRRGPTLWKLLQDAGVPATVFRAPVNFPPTDCAARTVSGITTPDIHGSYGVFSFYTEDPGQATRDVPGGRIERIVLENGRAACRLRGPPDSFKADGADVEAPFTIELDSERRAARVILADTQVLLRPGEWSDWITVRFPMLGWLAEVSGICRLYLKRTRPHLELYVSPVNIDPADPALPISTPGGYSRELVRDVGPFYTQGMPEDTSALSSGVFDDDEFRAQATFVLEEQMRFFRHDLNRFREGFLYSYFSSLDLDSHAFWRAIDPDHPLYTPELAARQGDFLPWLYARIDTAVGEAMQQLDERTLLLVISDHGFSSFRRQFNLNSWLLENGYARMLNPLDRGAAGYFMDTDWGRTRAYGLGINSLYLNLKGREPDGIVAPGAEAEALKTELIRRLTALVDPQTGETVMAHVYRPEDIYTGPCTALAPDLIVGYNRHHRASWDTILGKYPRDVLLDNRDPWSGDHCMDAPLIPGVLLCNRAPAAADPRLLDLAPSILRAFNVPVPAAMTGRAELWPAAG